MSIRCSGFASRSFIIGSRLWPPAMMRASGPSRASDAIAPSTLVARSYSNGAGVCIGLPSLAGIRLRTPGDSLGSYCTGESVPMTGERGSRSGRDWRPLRVEQARREAAAGRVAQRPAPSGLAAAIGASRPRRASVSVPSRVDLARSAAP